MRAPTLVLLLLAAACAVALVAAAAEPSCDGSSPSSDSCNGGGGGSPVAAAAGQFDPYLPAPVDPSSEAPRVMHMWTTPLFVSQPKLRDASTFNRILSKRALDAFEYLSKREAKAALAAGGAAEAAAARGDSAAGFNERFFQWQQEQHAKGLKAEVAYLKMTASSEFKSLLALFSSYSLSYLEAVGKSPEWVAEASGALSAGKLFCWATVARSGSYHMSHTHPDHLLSGVYYSRIPASGAGTIVFDDPRGPRWPFDGRYIHEPTPGQLIMFPSWLVHQVTPTLAPDHEARVSFSCNVEGSWEGLSDVNLG